MEVWVVDNASEPALTIDQSDRDTEIHLLRNDENRGFGGGLNLALQKILTEDSITHVLLLNTDVEIEEHHVADLVQALCDNPKVGVIGPVLLEIHDGREQVSLGGRDIAWHVHTREWGELPRAGSVDPVDYVPGTVALLRKSVLAEVGLFDEQYFFSGEMADLCRRIQRVGCLCAVSGGVVVRHGANDRGGLRDTLYPYYNLRNRFLFARKFGGLLKPLLFVWWVMCGSLMWVKALVAGPQGKARAVAAAIGDGFAGKFGNSHERFCT